MSVLSLSLGSGVVVLPFPGRVAVSFRTLSVKDLQALVRRLDLPPVEFAVETLAYQAQDLPEAAAVLRQLPRPTLLRLLRSWAADPNTLEAAPSEICSFADFKRIVKKKVDGWLLSLRQLRLRMAKFMGLSAVPLFSRTLADELAKIGAAAQNLSAMVEETARVTTEFARVQKKLAETFRASLPDPKLMQQVLQDADRGREHLDAHGSDGYGFAVFETSLGWLRVVAREKPDSKEIHRAFLDMPRDPEFAEQLVTRMAASRKLRHRKPVVQAILTAHFDRNYALSVPCLYAQLEGILTDQLVLEGLARRAGSDTLSAGTGERLIGLKKKAGEYGKKETAMRTFVTVSILERLIPDRNAVLHGSKTAYRQAKRSARLLLLVNALTCSLAEAESKR